MNTETNLNPFRLKVPISSPTMYKPLILITLLTCLLQFSGSFYIKKFMIQILDSHTPKEGVKETTSLDFALPLIILLVRLAVIFLMAFLVKTLRIRFLYFISLFLTIPLLFCLALASEPTLIGLVLSDTTLKWIKTSIICLHVFSVQLGLNTLPQLLEISIFPTSCKSAMKGIMRLISSIILVVFVFIFKNPLLHYSHTFFLMTGVLLISSPLLYLYVPEIRNIGPTTSAEFFLPSQTIFYFLPPKSVGRSKQAVEKWNTAVRKISAYSAFIKRQITQETIVDESSKKYPTVKFADDIADLDGINPDEYLPKKNKERVHYVSNVLCQSNSLTTNTSKQRVLIGKGPIKFEKQFLKCGSIFLFNDLLIVATCVVSNRRYIWEVSFNRDQLETVRTEETLSLSDQTGKHMDITFEDADLASLWNRYIHVEKQGMMEEEEKEKTYENKAFERARDNQDFV